MLAISTRTGRDTDPQRYRIRSIRCNRWNTGEHECWKGDETTAAGYRIERTAQYAHDEKKKVGVEIQITDVSQRSVKKPKASLLDNVLPSLPSELERGKHAMHYGNVFVCDVMGWRTTDYGPAESVRCPRAATTKFLGGRVGPGLARQPGR
jgi:hypothetical protein